MSSFVDSIESRLNETGLSEAEFVSATPESPGWRDADAIFRLGPFRLKFIRDHRQEFVELASEPVPEKFYQFDDVAMAMGWWSLEDVFGGSEPRPIDEILQHVTSNFALLSDSFSGDRERLTRARVERAGRERTKAIIDGRFAKR